MPEIEGFTPLPPGFTPLPAGFRPVSRGQVTDPETGEVFTIETNERGETVLVGRAGEEGNVGIILNDPKRQIERLKTVPLVPIPPELKQGPTRTSLRRQLKDTPLDALVRSNLGDIGLGDIIPVTEVALSVDDLLELRAKAQAGLDVGAFEAIATALAVPLTIIPLIGGVFGRGVRMTGKQLDEVAGLLRGNKFSDQQIENVLEALRRFDPTQPVDITSLPPTNITGVADPLITARTKIGTPTIGDIAEEAKMSRTDRVVTEILDDLRPVKIAAQVGAERAGVTPDLSSYREMRLVAGVRGVVEAVQKRGTIGYDTAGDIVFTGKGLNDVFAPIGHDLENAMLYFAGRRAKELAKRGKEKLFSSDEIEAMVRLGDLNPAFETAFLEYQAFNRRLLDFAEQSDLLSAAQKARFIEMGQDYVPFYRAALDETGKVRVKGGLFKRLRGGDANVNEIADNIFRNMVMIVEGSVKNAAKLRVYDMIDTLKLDDWAVRIAPPVRAAKAEKAAKALKELGVENADELATTFTFNNQLAENVDFVFRDGKRVFYEIKDPVFLKAMTAFTPRDYHLAMRILGGFKNLLTRLVTASPDFMIVNGIRDTQAAFLQSGARGRFSFKPLWSSARGLSSRLLKDESYWLLLANGGGFSTTFKGETGAARNLAALYTSRGINFDRVLTSPRKLIDAWEEITSSFEMAARIEEFRLVRAGGASAREAAFSAREVSTDFAMRGQSDFVRIFTTSVPFMNARMQGVGRLVREAANNPVRLATKALVAMVLPSIALHLYNRNDPRYKALPDWVRDLHWVIFVPGVDEPYLIPKGFEYGALFATVPERFIDLIAEQHGSRFADAMARIVAEQLSMNPIPQMLKPAVEIGMNESFFFGSPIVPVDLEEVKPSEQFRPWTSETMVEIAKILSEDTGIEVSPLQAEHLVRGYFGTIGMYVLDVSDMLVRTVTDKGPRPTARADEIPVLRRFLRNLPLRQTRWKTEFYELLSASRQITATITKVLDEARKPNLTDKEKTLFALAPALGEISKAAAQTNEAIRLTNIDQNLSGDEKRRRIDRLLERQNAMFEQLMMGLEEKGIRP